MNRRRCYAPPRTFCGSVCTLTMRLTWNSPIASSNDYYTFRTIIIERFPVHPTRLDLFVPHPLRWLPSSKPPANHVALPQRAYSRPCRPPAPCGLAPRPTRTSRTVIVNATTDVGWGLVSQLCGPAHGVANSHALAFPKWRVGSGYGLPWVSLVAAVCFFFCFHLSRGHSTGMGSGDAETREERRSLPRNGFPEDLFLGLGSPFLFSGISRPS
jgi:hypothetical protein